MYTLNTGTTRSADWFESEYNIGKEKKTTLSSRRSEYKSAAANEIFSEPGFDGKTGPD